MRPAPIDTLPGFRRRFIVTPAADRVSSEVEDDYHFAARGDKRANCTHLHERQSDSSRLPVGNCYTFQPERITAARRVGMIRDFSQGPRPLEEHRPAP